MHNHLPSRVNELLERLNRLSASEEWRHDLNPTQTAALEYLARANRFSRAPSQVAEYLAATRGTVSQTLKALARKGLIEERRSETDRRWISYDVTKSGRDALGHEGVIDAAVASLSARDALALEKLLKTVFRTALDARHGRPFGICRECAHHQASGDSAFCGLLQTPLTASDAGKICHEFSDEASESGQSKPRS